MVQSRELPCVMTLLNTHQVLPVLKFHKLTSISSAELHTQADLYIVNHTQSAAIHFSRRMVLTMSRPKAGECKEIGLQEEYH